MENIEMGISLGDSDLLQKIINEKPRVMESNVGGLKKMLQKNTSTTDGNCRERLKMIHVGLSHDG